MFSIIWSTIFFNPIYNGLIFLIGIVPFADVGIAVILLTVFVKLVLFPFSLKMVKTQLAVKQLEPEITKLKETHKDDKQEQARKTMALYKEKGVNPFSGFLLILVQIPVIFALYWVFFRGGLPEINTELLYSFISEPEKVNMNFIGLIDVSAKSALLALFAGVTQYFQIKFSLPPMKARQDKASLKEDLARSFHIQMRYVMPVIVFAVAYAISVAVALYWTTSNLFAIGQEIYVRKKIKNKHENQNALKKVDNKYD
ncbi:MAG: YidC/Oxa1 family membrane protein insertase [Candidatus Pacebacteria bacterium]|jgi:YidC/Oxa1 family membrane protein insertase|nr:YidC/Oxa1 family membrane protein insertase [Candidatus Paceibacterota bacterium]|tara:strand:+ start:9534 stop:10301 length:768 start_codon:yes stop_codon:yes gene_type:complete